MKRLFLLPLFFCLASLGLFAEQSTLTRSLSATLLVADPESAADLLISWTEERKGYFLLRSTDMVILRFPAGDLETFKSFLDTQAEAVYDLSIGASDVSEELAALRSGIRAREEILAKNLSYIDGADVKGTLAIEREVNRLLNEIESMKGRLNRLLVDAAMARAEIAFTYREETLPSNIPSSFTWMNRLDFYDFMREGF
ncbi:MAG: DUF4349 domain-containing protein [Spirochaetales bacterium]|nr:DUF4349 domain-containing protein [Spirochaetales bacterium]